MVLPGFPRFAGRLFLVTPACLLFAKQPLYLRTQARRNLRLGLLGGKPQRFPNVHLNFSGTKPSASSRLQFA